MASRTSSSRLDHSKKPPSCRSARISNKTSGGSRMQSPGRTRSAADELFGQPAQKRRKLSLVGSNAEASNPSDLGSNSMRLPVTLPISRYSNQPSSSTLLRARGTRHETSSEYTSNVVEASRAALLWNNPHVHQARLEEMVAAYLPKDEVIGLEALYQRLIDEGVVDDEKKKWITPEVVLISPASETGREPREFGFVEDLFEIIMDHYKAVRISSSPLYTGTTTHVISKGNTRPITDRLNTGVPDGSFVIDQSLREGPEVDLTYDHLLMVCPIEFKKVDSEDKARDDFSNVVWSMHRIMRNDARRRFTFGLTMEDTKIRLWFHDRAVVLASEAFDLHSDWRQFVHILVALGTADCNRLGYDDTVSLVQIHEHANTYDITVFSDVGETTTYRTIERISDYGTDILTGRGTRVWKVRKIVNEELEGPFLVLKDSWISNDPQPEHVILNDVRQSLSANLRHFLTRAQAGLVPHTKSDPSVRDHTLEVHRRGVVFSSLEKLHLLCAVHQSAHRPFQKKLGDINTIHRLHYRIVFQEVGRPLSELGNLDEMFFTLQGALRGLGALHDLGYIHRDISPHNVLLVARERQPTNCRSPTSPTRPHPSVPVEAGHELVPVIMDLEYTVKASSNEALRHLRTGTWQFMATEVLIGCWNFPDEIEQKDDEAFESVPHFRQHALHDIEPIFWMAIWVLFKFGVPSAPENFSKEDYKTSYCKIFPPAGDVSRSTYCHTPRRIAVILRKGLPAVYHVFVEHLYNWYRRLLDNVARAYLKAFPHMNIAQIGKSSQESIRYSTTALQSMRDVIAENPNLRERVTSVNTILDPPT